MPLDRYRLANRQNWDDRVPIHRASADYGADAYVADPTRISGVVAFDRPALGDVRGRSLLHLQCHFGRDTLSWASLGAVVTGIDFSQRAIAEASQLSEASGVPGRFIVSELYDSPDVLDEQFDIVYTGVGAVNWLPDIGGWARVVAGFLKPGGTFYMREGHPMLWSLDDAREDDLLVVAHPYFETVDPGRWVTDTTYTDGDATLDHPVTYEWSHGLGEVITAVLDAGLVITRFEEHRFCEWKALPSMVHGSDGRFRLPAGRDRLPLMYTLVARK